MKRTQVQFDEEVYEALRRRAFERGISMSALLRQVLREHLVPQSGPFRVEDFRFIGSGRGGVRRKGKAISELHDQEIAEAFAR
jgi:hypothetical protein